MEHIKILLNKPDDFDSAVHGNKEIPALPEGGNLEFITKDNATESQRAGIVITFTVMVDGELRRAQAVTTVRNMLNLGACLQGRYDENGRVREHLKGV